MALDLALRRRARMRTTMMKVNSRRTMALKKVRKRCLKVKKARRKCLNLNFLKLEEASLLWEEVN